MINPVNMTLLDWADSVVLSVGDAWSFGRLDDEANWQEWAVNLNRAFATRNPPDPYAFTDWRDYAMRVYPFLETVTVIA